MALFHFTFTSQMYFVFGVHGKVCVVRVVQDFSFWEADLPPSPVSDEAHTVHLQGGPTKQSSLFYGSAINSVPSAGNNLE